MFFLMRGTSKIGAFLIIIFGGIASLWSNCILVANLKNKMRSEHYISVGYDEYNTIILTIQLSYLGVFVITSATLLWAFNKSLKSFLIPWSLLKLCENIIFVVGSITLYFRWSFYGLVPFGIMSFVLNVYVSLIVYKTYKKIESMQLVKEYENDLKGIVQKENIERNDKASQTDETSCAIDIKKISYNSEIKNNKDNPFNYIHTHVPNIS